MNKLLLSDPENLSAFPLKSLTKKIFNFYYTQLKFNYEKEFFISHFKDDRLSNSILQLTELFHKYPFYNSLILERARNKREVDLFTKWQRKYYLDIYNEYHSEPCNNNSNAVEIYKILQTNSSFQFLINLFKDLNREIEGINLSSTLYKGFAYYNLKLKDPFQKKKKTELMEELNLYTKIFNSGGSVRDLISIEEQNQNFKSIKHLPLNAQVKGN